MQKLELYHPNRLVLKQSVDLNRYRLVLKQSVDLNRYRLVGTGWIPKHGQFGYFREVK